MSLLTKYILTKYLKNFIIVLNSLELFFVGIDLLQNYKELPDSANLQLLYVLYNGFFTLTLTLPLALVFAWIVTLVLLIRGNELVAFIAVGASKRSIYKPVVFVSSFLLLILIGLQATPLAYSYDLKSKIKDGEYFVNTQENIFLKYNDVFVYFEKLYPLKKVAQNVHIYKIKDKDIVESIVAKKAYFQNNRWYVVDAKVLQKPANLQWKESKLDIQEEKFLHTLEGFKPKILDSVYEAKSSFSILDAFNALFLLKDQKVNTDKIRAALYYEILIPFFVLPIIMLVFAYASLNSRFFNMPRFTSISIFGTLIVWGFFFMLFKLSNGGVVKPEFSLLASLIVWYFIALYFYKAKERYDG